MPKQTLIDLTNDVTRLLVAGAQQAPGDDGLRRRGQRLRELGKQVAALNPIADAVDKVLTASPKQASPALLDLAVVVKQVKASLTAHGDDGALEPISGGTWSTATPVRDVHSLQEKLTEHGYDSGGRMQELNDAVDRNAYGDMRLIQPLMRALGHQYAPLAELVAEKALPMFGPAVLPYLEDGLNLKGKALDARKVLSICTIDRNRGKEICLKAIDEGSERVKVQALECLGTVAPEIVESVAMKFLSDPKGEVRAAACVALKNVPKDEVLNAMIGLAGDTKEVWGTAEKCLAAFAHPRTAKRLLEELDKAVVDYSAVKDAPKKKAAPTTPAKGKAAKKPAKPAKSPEQKERERLQDRIERFGTVFSQRSDNAIGVDSMLALTTHSAADVRVMAVAYLGRHFAGKSPKLVPALIDALKDKNGAVVEQAVDALGDVGATDRDAITALLKLAGDAKQKGELRAQAIDALGHPKTTDPRVLPFLVGGLNDKKRHIKERSIDALENMEATAAPALLALLDCLGDKDVQYYCHSTFAAIDPDGTTAIPLLMSVAKNGKAKRVARENALAAVHDFDDEKVVAHLSDLIALLDDKDKGIRRFVLGNLRYGSLWAVPALPKLFELLRKGLGAEFDSAFAHIEPDGTTSIPALADALQDKDKTVRKTALQALAYYQRKASAAIPAIESLLTDKDKGVRDLAKKTLDQIR